MHRASHDTVAGLLTPPGRGALAVVRVSGPAAPRLLADLSRSARRGTQSDGDAGRLRIARWSGTGGELVVVHPVDSRTIDVTCHGGPVAARIILRDLVSRGARGIDWGELARLEAASRVRGESVEALARATTLRSAAILLDQFHGALDRAVGAIASTLRSGEISSAPPSLARLLGRTSVGLHLAAPWRVAIVGRPNAGKSSLLNALVGYERAIVDAHEGTTRDLVTAETATDGWWLELWDSAGVRDGAGELEAAGIHRVRDALSASDLQLLVMDRSRPICEMDLALRAACPQPIVVATKADLPPAWGQLADGAPPFTVSARTGEGIVQLTAGLARFLVPRPPAPGDAVPFTVRQVELLETARSRVESGDPAGAVRALEDLVGSACV